ncbi:MAG: hypothetical protein H0W61_16645 [Bacteroidetes bacterium]|nr:hypothetical protein [Bacteroidota bacterium]
MKNYILSLFCFFCFTLSTLAQMNSDPKKDSTTSYGYHRFSFNFTWFELGASIPLKEQKLQNLPYGMNSYLYGPKGGFAGGLFGLGLYYKNHWGLSAIFIFQDYSVPDAAFKDYISSQYPGHFLPSGVQGHTYTLYNINYRLSYRFQKNHFIYEPQIQIGVNDCDDFDTHFTLKEVGSNKFIEYDIKKENTRKNIFSYHAAIKAIWCFSKADRKWNVEPGLRLDFMVIPTNFKYTISSTPFNMPATIFEVNVKRMRPAITITAFLSFFRK